MDKQSLHTTGLLLLLGMLWGAAFSIARYAVTHGVPPLGYAFWQALAPMLLLSLYQFTRSNWRFICKPQYIRYYCAVGLLGILLPNVNKYALAAHAPSGTLAIVTSTMPLFIYPMAIIAGEESFHLRRFGGVLLGVLGILAIVLSSFGIQNLSINHWTALALLTPFCYALSSVYAVNKRPEHSDSIVLAQGMLLAATIMLIPLVLFSHQFYPLRFEHHPATYAILTEALFSTIGYILLFEIFKRAGSVSYSLTDGIVALTGLILGWIFFHESIHPSAVFAMLCIFTGIVLVQHKNDIAEQKLI